MGVTYYVGVDHGAVSINDIADVIEVLDHIHTLVLDAAGLQGAERDEIIAGLEKLIDRAEDIAAEKAELD